MSFNPSISHYRRKHAPNRLYISPEFNASMMHKDFCDSNPDVKVSYTYYYQKIKKLNISFVKLGEEECERCNLQDKHLEELHGLDKSNFNIRNDENKTCKKQTFDNCTSCKEFENHIQVATEARKRYREEKERKWDDDELVVSVDMQKVIMLPRIPGLKVVVFCKRIVLLNETFAPVGGSMKGRKEKSTGVLWHEAIKSPGRARNAQKEKS